jgi:hypothetical protein
MAAPSPHQEHEHGAGVLQTGTQGSHQNIHHAPATRADITGQTHHAHDSGGADHSVSGHDKHAGHSVDMFRQKFWGTLPLSIPTVIWGPMIQHWFEYEAPGGPVATRWIPAVFGTLVFGYGGWVFIRGAVNKIRDRLPGMMTLISLAITVAFGFSLAVTFGFPGSDLWWELATLVTIMVLDGAGHFDSQRPGAVDGSGDDTCPDLFAVGPRFTRQQCRSASMSSAIKGSASGLDANSKRTLWRFCRLPGIAAQHETTTLPFSPSKRRGLTCTRWVYQPFRSSCRTESIARIIISYACPVAGRGLRHLAVKLSISE